MDMARNIVVGEDWTEEGLAGGNRMGSSTDVANMDYSGMLWLPVRGKPKARPRVGVNNKPFMPAKYMAWKEELGHELQRHGLTDLQLDNSMSLEVVFGTEGMWIQLRPVPEFTRPKHVRADIDNLIGGLMDGLQDAGVIANDDKIVEVHGWLQRRQ